jgi:hypothetical protein
MFSIHIDRAQLLVDMRLSGFFTPAVAQDATIALRNAVRSLGPAIGRHVTLYDATDLQVAPGVTIEQVQAGFADPAIRHLWARRVAYCTPSALSRMQAARLRTVRSDIGVFATRDEALAWLLEVSADPDTPAA